MTPRVLLLVGLCVAVGQAQAGLFNDDEARLQVQQVGARVTSLEEAIKKQTEINNQQAETNTRQAENNKQQTHTQLDIQSQIELLNTELRSLRGQNEELVHNLQDAEKRQKDFYIDLDTRLRHFETADPGVIASPQSATGNGNGAAEDVLVTGNRAYETAHGLLKAGKNQDAVNAFQGFLKDFPESVYIASAHYEMGSAYLELKDFQNAQLSFQELANKFAFSAKAPEALLNIADCQLALKDVPAAKKTLKQLIAKYPGSEAATEAKKRLDTLK
jgi:tol-pal system protein YbgF